MQDLSTYTPTELLKMINDCKIEHDNLKQEIIDHTYEVEELEKIINQKLDNLDGLEKKYIDLIETLNNKENV